MNDEVSNFPEFFSFPPGLMQFELFWLSWLFLFNSLKCTPCPGQDISGAAKVGVMVRRFLRETSNDTPGAC